MYNIREGDGNRYSHSATCEHAFTFYPYYGSAIEKRDQSALSRNVQRRAFWFLETSRDVCLTRDVISWKVV